MVLMPLWLLDVLYAALLPCCSCLASRPEYYQTDDAAHKYKPYAREVIMHIGSFLCVLVARC